MRGMTQHLFPPSYNVANVTQVKGLRDNAPCFAPRGRGLFVVADRPGGRLPDRASGNAGFSLEKGFQEGALLRIRCSLLLFIPL
ncbi:MAG: hypothetical protein AB9872_03445 [Solidesulfovibrio sp.]